jgi:hypothetical protein
VIVSLSTYTDLKTAVAAWISRSDLTTQIPDFIQLAEDDFNTRLRTVQQESRATLSITGEFVAVPADFLEVRSLRLDVSSPYALGFLPFDQGVAAYSASGQPKFFCITGQEFRFAPIPDSTYSATLIYYAKVPPLASNPTNWLLTRYPTLYLYGSILQAAAYIQDDPRVPGVKALYDEALERIKRGDAHARFGGNAMAMRAA